MTDVCVIALTEAVSKDEAWIWGLQTQAMFCDAFEPYHHEWFTPPRSVINSRSLEIPGAF